MFINHLFIFKYTDYYNLMIMMITHQSRTEPTKKNYIITQDIKTS